MGPSDPRKPKIDAPPEPSASSGGAAESRPRRKMPRGRPWQPGQSGNPKGRAPALADLRLQHMGSVDTVLKRLLLIALKGDPRSSVTVAACKEYLDRVTGKAPQPIVGEDGGAPINIDAPALVAALQRYVQPEGEKEEEDS